MNRRRDPLSGVDLNLLVALHALLDERSVTRAAARLSITQPSMSGALARLRALFCDELLVRSGRGMRPTSFAETLEAPVRRILADVDETVFSRADFDPRHDERAFTVLATDYPTLVLLRPLIAALRDEAPGIRIRVETARAGDLASRLSLDDSDLAIVPAGLGDASSLASEPLFTDRFVGAAWRDNPHVADPLTFEQLRTVPYLSFRQGSATAMMDSHLGTLGHRLEPSTIVESFLVGAMMLRETMQVAFLQERLAWELREAAELQLLEPPVELPLIRELMVWHPRAGMDPAQRWLRARISALASDMAP